MGNMLKDKEKKKVNDQTKAGYGKDLYNNPEDKRLET